MADKVSFNGVEFNQSFMVSDFVSWFGCQFQYFFALLYKVEVCH